MTFSLLESLQADHVARTLTGKWSTMCWAVAANVSAFIVRNPALRSATIASRSAFGRARRRSAFSATMRSASACEIASTLTTRPPPGFAAYFAPCRWRISELVTATPAWSRTSASGRFHHLSASSAPSVFAPSNFVHSKTTVSPRALKKSRPSLLVWRQKAVVAALSKIACARSSLPRGAWRATISLRRASMPAVSSPAKSVSTVSITASATAFRTKFTSGFGRMTRGSRFLRTRSRTAPLSP